jgi:hypothetical protein
MKAGSMRRSWKTLGLATLGLFVVLLGFGSYTISFAQALSSASVQQTVSSVGPYPLVIPEPAMMALFGIGLVALAARFRARRKPGEQR